MARAAVLLGVALPALSPAAPGFDLARPEVREFVERVAATHGFDVLELARLVSDTQPQQSVLDAISRPAERVLAWWEYRERFLTRARIDAGLAFWTTHAEALDRVAAARGVPAQYLVAIVGVETSYGRSTGRYRVLDALATLGFDHPPRAAFFRGELEQFLLMTREEGLDPRTQLGSYAGAMGAPQFMPSSFRRYAVDGDADGRRDLAGSWDDVFASIANFLVAHGWRAGEPVLAEVTAGSHPDDQPEAFRLELRDTVASLRDRGYRFDTTLADTAPAMLVPAERPDGIAWRAGFANFHVITRYNRSSRYAMAVHDLAQALATARADAAAGAGDEGMP